MCDIVLHIGTPKTGTTALQNFLKINNELLNQTGVVYPSFSIPKQDSKNGTFLRKYCEAVLYKDNSYKPDGFCQDWMTITKAVTEYDTVVLSDEGIYLTPDTYKDDINPLAEFWGIMLAKLATLKIRKIIVIVYLRNQDEYISSLWKHECKTGRNRFSFVDFSEQKRNQNSMNYCKILRVIKSCLREADSIIVRRYDRANFIGGDIFHDFCSVTNIGWNPKFILPDKDSNQSISYDVAEVVRSFYYCGRKGSPLRDDIIIPFAYELSNKFPDDLQVTPFTNNELRLLKEKYNAGNKEVANIYLYDDWLFVPTNKYSVEWKPNQKRVAKLKVMLFIRLLFNKNWYTFIHKLIQSFF